MGRAIVHDPKDLPSIVVGRSRHHLLDESVKRFNAIARFTAAKDSGAVDIQGRNIGPGTATEILVFHMHGSPWSASLRGLLAAAGLNAGLLIGRDNEFIVLERFVLPLAGVEIQDAPSFGGEFWIAGKDPTAVIPRPNGVFM